MNIKKIVNEQRDFLGASPDAYFSPGRVNLIGEHIDYLGGRVLPTAIDLGTYAFVTKRDDRQIRLLSHNYQQDGMIVASLDDLTYDPHRGWANYATGMLQALIKRNMTATHGLNILIYGTLPNGAGLSSSASLEVLIGHLVCDQYHYAVDTIELSRIAQQVENQYIGVNCGIMDQFAVAMGKRNHAIYLDTESLDFEWVPLELKEHTIVIANTNKKRALADSKYNERRSECDVGLAQVQAVNSSIENLCDISYGQYLKLAEQIAPEVIRRRVKHAVTETDRTKQAVVALRANDLEKFGNLMDMSHESLKNDFEVSCFELDQMVDSFQKHGALGARMTGAGFGGCVVAILPDGQLDIILEKVRQEYNRNTDYEAEFYRCQTSDGTHTITKEEWR